MFGYGSYENFLSWSTQHCDAVSLHSQEAHWVFSVLFTLCCLLLFPNSIIPIVVWMPLPIKYPQRTIKRSLDAFPCLTNDISGPVSAISLWRSIPPDPTCNSQVKQPALPWELQWNSFNLFGFYCASLMIHNGQSESTVNATASKLSNLFWGS